MTETEALGHIALIVLWAKRNGVNYETIERIETIIEQVDA